MKIETMDAMHVRMAMKRNTGLSGLAEKYGCSEEDVARRVRMLFPHEGEKILRQLADSAKKANGHKNRSTESTADKASEANGTALTGEADEVTPDANDVPTPMVELPAVTSGLKPLERTTVENLSVMFSDNPDGEIAFLKQRAEYLKAEIAQAECDYHNAFNYHTAETAFLKAAAERLQVIQESFERAYGEFERLVETDNAYSDVMRASKAKLKARNQELSLVKTRLRELETTTLCLYEDGRVEVFEGPEIPLNMTGVEGILAELVNNLAYEALRLKDLKALASALAIKRNAESDGSKAELLIESPEVLLAYNSTLVGETSPDEGPDKSGTTADELGESECA